MAYIQDIICERLASYVLRPILAIKWIEQGHGVAPTAFGELVDCLVTDPGLRAEIDALIEVKRSGAELDYGPRMPAISSFIESELQRLELAKPDGQAESAAVAPLDAIFRQALREAWG